MADLQPGADAVNRDRVRATVGATEHWVLESRHGGDTQRTPLQTLPFTIGRSPGSTLLLPATHVSRSHARIYSDGLVLRLRDLGSRNGTFLNRHPVTDVSLHEGDLIGIGDYEFYVVPAAAEANDTVPLERHLAAALVRELLDRRAVGVAFQPIVDLATGLPVAYEALGAGALAGLPVEPVELFDLAGALGSAAQAELSRLFRQQAVEAAGRRPEPVTLFLNTHPADLEQPGLVASLAQLRRTEPRVKLVLEVHESALANLEFVSGLRDRLVELDIGLAYVEFGAGQSRFLELASAPPDYLKFDRQFVIGIAQAAASR